MREYVLTLLVAAAVTYLLTPLVRRGAIRVGAMHEARDRDVHVVPMPLLGGVAMYGGLAAGLLVASRLVPLRDVFAGTSMESGLLLAGGLLVVVGFVDDRWGMSPLGKLAGQVAAGVIIAYRGPQVGWLPYPGGGTLDLTDNQSLALTILVVVATINAVNFIDGLDGLATGIVCIAAVSFFIYSYTLTRALHLSAEAGPALASAVLAGVCLGFLPHNFYPARIFMGDTGAMLLGLLLAYAPISSIYSTGFSLLTNRAVANRFPEVLPLLLPAAILVIPYTDMLLAVLRRTKAGVSISSPDRKHLHHRLLDIGHSHRSSVLIMYLWAALFSGTVVWLAISKTQLFVFAVVALAAMLALLLMSMPRLRWWERGRGTTRQPGEAGPARWPRARPRPRAPGLPPRGVRAHRLRAHRLRPHGRRARGLRAQGRPAPGRRDHGHTARPGQGDYRTGPPATPGSRRPPRCRWRRRPPTWAPRAPGRPSPVRARTDLQASRQQGRHQHATRPPDLRRPGGGAPCPGGGSPSGHGAGARSSRLFVTIGDELCRLARELVISFTSTQLRDG